jgi:hypothetical protein
MVWAGVGWLALAFVAILIAWSRGRSGLVWGLINLVLPIAGLVLLLALPNKSGRKCPQCAERVRKEARVCKHCGAAIAPVRR